MLDGANITFTTPGIWTAKGGFKEFVGGARGAVDGQVLPNTRVKLFHEQFGARNAISGLPVPDMPYRIELADGTSITGVTDKSGKTQTVMTSEPQSVRLFWTAQADADAPVDHNAVEGC